MDRKKPLVSVIIPTFNEASTIEVTLSSLMDDYTQSDCEFLIADGMSTDGTRDVIQNRYGSGQSVKLIDNSDRYQVFGINRAIEQAQGKYIIRADAHALYPANYIKNCVELLEKTDAWNVGGVMVPEGRNSVQKAIALVMQHPVGVGDARFHLGNYSGYVDTVYLGAFPKRTFDKIGLFDTNCRTNEDAELNLRITKSGGKIYLDSSLKVTYFPRESLGKLARQYFLYGQGRCYTTLKHRAFTSWRQFAPVVLVLALAASIPLGFWNSLTLLFGPLYVLTLSGVCLVSWPKKRIPLRLRLLMIPALILMHTSWGLGFLSHLVIRPFRRRGTGDE